jgi:hypothetical protein
MDGSPGLDFYDDQAFDDEVGAVTTDALAVEMNVEPDFEIHSHPFRREKNRKRIRIDGLEKAGAQLRMRAVKRSQDAPREIAMQKPRFTTRTLWLLRDGRAMIAANVAHG